MKLLHNLMPYILAAAYGAFLKLVGIAAAPSWEFFAAVAFALGFYIAGRTR
ncbi:hypothetical protein PAN31117_03124 [Pandoraea anapnoica]|uniref:Uncharacterized protein n=1 Tax=Pandoraea anapnoica TaxID=2508301 RepID=A0A5E5A5G0_9BURK|nr:hypothetical protein [Pandoraea anapnoica]VVE68891.1 hypothetical protein PAN31117_03124 [Pandoraea anapnoica]